jgi:hypothetical protein
MNSKFFAALVIAGTSAVITQAQIIHVPADYSTIQQGIDAASDGDTVLVDPGTYDTINFTGKNITVASLFLTSQDTSYISQTILDGNSLGNYTVQFAGNEDSTAVLCGFTVTKGWIAGISIEGAHPKLRNLIVVDNGYAIWFIGGQGYPYHYGGLICVNGGFTLENSTITGNHSVYGGGGIFCGGNANVILDHVIISGNSAEYGGGISCSYNAEVALENVLISGNSGISEGGGIYCGGSAVSLKNTSIRGNTSGSGGGIYSYGPGLSFNDTGRCSIYDNTANDGNDLFSDTWMEVKVDTFTVLIPNGFHAAPIGNFSFDILNGYYPQADTDVYISPGGNDNNTGITPEQPLRTIRHAFSVITADSSHQRTIHLLEGTYSPSTTGENFPIYLIDFVNLAGTRELEVIVDAEGTAGVVRVEGNTNNKLSFMTLKGGSSGSGAGLYCYMSTLDLENLIITANTMDLLNDIGAGGGIYCWGSAVTMKNITITDNHSSLSESWGGGICLGNSCVFMNNVYISGNTLDGDECRGGGICIGSKYNTASVTMEDVHITNNTINGYHGMGGGLYCMNSVLTVLHSSVENNGVTGELAYGGGIYYTEDASPVFSDVTIGNNEASGPYSKGGGIYCLESQPVFENVSILSNIASGFSAKGGGMYSEHSDAILENVVVQGNYAELSGGGIACYKFSDPRLTNVLICGNEAVEHGAGLFCEYECNPVLQNVTMSWNFAQEGGGIYCRSDVSPQICNSIIWNNLPHEIFFYPEGGDNSITISYSCLKGGLEGIVTNGNGTVNWLEGNTGDDPCFIAAGDHYYALTGTSPCIDTGTPDTTGLGLPPWDILGNLRIWDGDGDGSAVVDMGAYEYGSLPVGLTPLFNLQCSMLNVQCFPNPLSDHTIFNYELHEPGTVNLTIFNHLGKQIAVLVNEQQARGKYQVQWDAHGLPAGVYFYRLTAIPAFAGTSGKLVVVR